MPRKNKTKKQVVNDIKQVQEADRLRKSVREVVYPFLLELNNTVGYAKLFLQVCAVTVESAFNNTSKEKKVGDFMETFVTLFKDPTDENKKYLEFLGLMKDETISSFVSLIEQTPRAIEKYYVQKADKMLVLDMPIDEILG